ncbi:hypothetical protein Phum_PHUM600210 [Pediculus humanus corporis]|uniref:Proteasome assembly chaperone 1 n=1 Tax=Pediculus humanus subsp. corporis TaxID=121224 RepID=E0W315_PEDHC|nr:uncharacterized protein Phum_PHUM600210 [Pediculus humanus corporis]EEB20021.1 hypothetical protein Phum_PHUM600210 [Pediculus humanus corporis]
MASYFGEIIEPTTRALFNDFSDEEDCSQNLQITFAEIFLLDNNTSPAAEIIIDSNESDYSNDPEISKKKILPSRIFLNKNNAICLISSSFTSESGYFFTQAILKFLQVSNKVYIFTNDSLYNYKTESLYDLPFGFIKELKTSYSSQKNLVDLLETPNFITGVSGAILSWCEIFKKNATAFICYTDQQKLDSITAEPYLSVFKKLNSTLLQTRNPNYNKKTFFGNPGKIGENSNIYL